ncbi:MAG TPA: glycosyltransferase family 4 protein [Tepidisphaeraceae bacterium]|nr:glycosyltransferase family 4 protein [Tepidisphaeraceae bacterium]
MSLTVLSVAYPLASVGPDAVGGAEQVLSVLDTALVKLGHRSLVVACEGSVTAGTLIPTPAPTGTITAGARGRCHHAHRQNIQAALDRYRVDVVHMHGIDFYDYLPPPGVPTLVTLHLPPGWYKPDVFQIQRQGTYLHCVSHSQQQACPPGATLLPAIENGVSLQELAFHCSKRRFAITLGRICPEKNFHVAMDAGRIARMPVLLAGQVFPYEAHQQYFQREILPRLDHFRRFLGPIGFRRKRRLLTAARCLLMPSLAPETSSLVAMESLACGTPVVAFPSGALPEIVEHGVTGFLVNSVHEMAWAMEAAGDLDPERCRDVARRRFSLEKMVEQYLAVYRRLASGGSWPGGRS